MEKITLIKEVLHELERQGIRYCLLRNYNFLLENRSLLSASERSVDMVVSQLDFAAFDIIMNRFSFSKRKQQFSLTHQAYFRIEDLEPVSFDVQVGGVHWNDMQYLDETILVNRVKKDFFYVPGDNDTFVMLTAHSILGKRYFKPEYQNYLLELAAQVDFNYVRTHLQNIFNTSIARELITLVQQHKFEVIMRRKMRYILVFLIHQNRMRTFIPLFFRWLRWKRILQPYPLISIIGPDGAGKSSLTASLAKYLSSHNRKVKVIYTGRGRGQILPFSSLGRRYKNQEKKRDTKQKPVLWKRKAFYTLFAPLFALDLGLRYAMHIMRSRRQGKIVITDRYCSDIWLMKHVPVWFKKGLLFLFPTPTLTFYLYNSAEVLHDRRPNESVEELQRQMSLFSQLESRMPLLKIKTEDQEKTRTQVLKIVMTFLYQHWY